VSRRWRRARVPSRKQRDAVDGRNRELTSAWGRDAADTGPRCAGTRGADREKTWSQPRCRNWPVRENRGAMIDQVISIRPCAYRPRRVTLHAPWIGGGRGGGGQSWRRAVEAAFRPVGGRLRRHGRGPSGYRPLFFGTRFFDHEHAGARGARPERDREMFGVPGRRVDRFLQVQLGVDMAQEELRGPLVLLIAAGRNPRPCRARPSR